MRMQARLLSGAIGAALLAPGCASSLEIPIETPLKSKLDVSKFRRVLVAGFVTDLVDEGGIDLSPETARLLQNQLRSSSKLQVIEPDRPPLNQALAKAVKPTEDVRVTRDDRDRYRAEGERLLQDTAFWRKLGEEFQNPLIVTGKLAFEEQNRSGFQQESALVRDSRGRVVERRGNRYAERKAYNLSADFSFIDGASGRLLHKERFSEEVVYGEEQKVSPLSSYFELMDRLLPNFLGVIAPQKIRGTRVLLP